MTNLSKRNIIKENKSNLAHSSCSQAKSPHGTNSASTDPNRQVWTEKWPQELNDLDTRNVKPRSAKGLDLDSLAATFCLEGQNGRKPDGHNMTDLASRDKGEETARGSSTGRRRPTVDRDLAGIGAWDDGLDEHTTGNFGS